MPNIALGEETSIFVVYTDTIFEADGFLIIKVKADYIPEKFPMDYGMRNVEFVAKGKFAAPDYVGQVMEIVGEWRFDSKYKKNTFVVSYSIPAMPVEKADVVKFIRSIRGIGAKTAQRICDAFDGDLNEAAKDADVTAATVKGLRHPQAKKLQAAVKRLNVCAEMTRILKDKVPSESIKRIANKYGSDALDIITSNPYEMTIDRTVPFPDADTIAFSQQWSPEAKERIEAGVLCAVRISKSANGSIVVPKDQVQTIATKILNVDAGLIRAATASLCEEHTLISAKNWWYLREDYSTEKALSRRIAEFATMEVAPKEQQKYLEKFSEWERNHPQMKLAGKQEFAVKTVSSHFISVVTGGPGTGKTSTLKAIMETYQMAFPGSNITLMAPTGLAAKRMSSSCGMEAMTIHKTLHLRPAENEAGFDDSNGISIDGGLIIVDEFSMVGLYLANFLFQAIVENPDVRIVIVGDVDQMPSVQAGSILEDLILSDVVTVTRLDRNFRQEAGSTIIDAAYAINAGNTNLPYNNGNFSYWEIFNNDIDIEAEQIRDQVLRSFADSIQIYGLDQTYVLAPQRRCETKDGKITTKTLLATAALNPLLRDIANPATDGKITRKYNGKAFRVGDRVINLKNDEDVMNGDIGYIKRLVSGETPAIIVDFDGTEVEFGSDRFKNLDWAYAITVHKSQGSEYDSVIYPSCMTQAVMLQRNLLYTAVTRAKKSVMLIGSRNSINKAIFTIGTKKKRDLLAARINYLVRKEKESSNAK